MMQYILLLRLMCANSQKNSFEQFSINYANEKLQQEVRLIYFIMDEVHSHCSIVQLACFQT